MAGSSATACRTASASGRRATSCCAWHTSLPQALQALPVGARVTSSACTGVMYAALDADAAGTVELTGLRAAVRPDDGSVVVLDAPEQLRAGLDHWGPVGDALPLMRRVKDRFDPGQRLSPGRYVGGI